MEPSEPSEQLTPEEHKEKHQELHRHLDELVADFIQSTGKTPEQATVMELIIWSNSQTIKPDEKHV